MTTRQNKVNSLLEHLVASYVLTQKFEGLTGLLTIKKAEVTADLEHAKIFFSVIGQDPETTLRVLNRHLREVQHMLRQNLKMKIVPRIAFAPDLSGEYADHISKLIQEIHNDDKRDA